MKKIAAMCLGLSLLAGTAMVFAEDAKDTAKTEKAKTTGKAKTTSKARKAKTTSKAKKTTEDKK